MAENMEPKNEVDKFFEDIPSQDTKIEESPLPEKEEKEEESDETKSEGRKNRRHRRLEEQLQAERESNIALTERIKVLAEVDKTSNRSDTEVPAEWLALHGDTPESQKAWQMEQRLLESYAQKAKGEALQEFEEKQNRVLEEQKKYESVIDSQLESLEDEHNVDLTSDAPAARKARREFLEMVQSLSPKDEKGNITGYADFDTAFGLYQKTRTEKVDNSRQKEIASKSMQRSGSSSNDNAVEDAQLKYLRGIGIRI